MDVGLLGPGVINGGANDPVGHLVQSYDEKNQFIVPQEWPNLPGCSSEYSYSCRPKLVVIKRCQDVLFSQGIQLLNSPLWTTTVIESNNILVENAVIKGDRRWPNNDGFDPIDSSNILIRNTTIETGDDCICLVTHTALPIVNMERRQLQSVQFAKGS